MESKLEKSLDKQMEKANPTKQKDVVRLPQKEKPQESDRERILAVWVFSHYYTMQQCGWLKK